jgi:hypothetical protein
MSKMLLRISSKLLSNSIATFIFDPFIPKLISFYLSQNLKKWKSNGTLKDYNVEVQRIGRLSYGIRFHIIAKKKETNKLLLDYISKFLATFLD